MKHLMWMPNIFGQTTRIFVFDTEEEAIAYLEESLKFK
jgi:hypothetical protein